MQILITGALFAGGLALVLYCAEQLVKGVVGTSLNMGISAFLVSVIFIGFDPDNLAVGTVASHEQLSGIVLGSIIGAALVAIALAFGITALFAPMTFKNVPGEVLFLPVGSVLLPYLLAVDGIISRLDGLILLLAFLFCIYRLVILSKQGHNIEASGEVAESLERSQQFGTGKSLLYLLGALIGIIIGSEMLVIASEIIIDAAGITETFFGMTILALLVSIEELARELPAALKGRPDITYGNVVGSVFAMLLFNAGIMALVNPIPISDSVLTFYFPFLLGTVLLIAGVMWSQNVSRLDGMALVVVYVLFLAGSYFFG